ncbi:Alpha-mannosyltransferase [Penicillium fimorum]|uniref:Alpha-mannosyltransferase n=1 Tax=Penicillium fimorum TaxID=1882269 RepID=A0A9X0C7V1_9EURO|nr:Alpha-mannosyltransferase [Penicillium fimorum]
MIPLIPRFLRVRTLLAALTLTIFLTWAILGFKIYIPKPISSQAITGLTPSHKQFWREFHALLDKHAPNTDPIIEYEKASTERFNPHNASPRPDTLSVPEEDIITMKEAHTGFVNAITDSPLSFPASTAQKV